MSRATAKMLKGVFLSIWGSGKTTLLTVMVALTLATVTPAFGANGSTFILGSLNNTATAITRLVGNVNGPSLYILNPSTGASATGALFQVASGHPPFRVTSATKVPNLNSDQLDGKDSTALGVSTKTNSQQLSSCITTPGSFLECAPVSVTVPAGKQYQVTGLSSLTIAAPLAGNARYCPGIKGGSIAPAVACIGAGSTPNGLPDQIDFAANDGEAGAGSGEIGPLPAGTYTFSTVVNATTAVVGSPNIKAHTTVLVRDVSAPGPPIG
jgi:hypothetical protein